MYSKNLHSRINPVFWYQDFRFIFKACRLTQLKVHLLACCGAEFNVLINTVPYG